MQSEEKNNWGSPTKALFIPKLPPSLSNWKTLKTHFSLFGDVKNVLINPQQRCCTVSFKTVSDAEYAKSKGCIWNNKKFDAFYCGGSRDSLRLDPRAVTSKEVGYCELDTIWSDEDNENFGITECKPTTPEVKPKKKISTTEKKEVMKSLERKKLKMKLYSEKIAKLKLTPKDTTKAVKVVKESLASKKKQLLVSKKAVKDNSVGSSKVVQGSLSLKEKFAILEERDKCIRKTFVKNSDVKLAKVVIGTCPDMCPEKERIMREYRRLVSVYEMIPGTQDMDHSLAVKAYVRSSADQEEPLPHELRPEPVLSMTMSYLICKIMPLIEDPNVNISDWYDFCWDRLRSIRKDIIQQQLCDLEIVAIIEQCARFHICCYDRLWGADPLVFDEKINTENLMNCLQSLRHMYEDLAKVNIKCPNEAEFNAYMILLNMKTGDLMATYQQFPENLIKEEKIQFVVKIYLTFNNSMYSQFFKLVKRSTYLNSCLLQRYFYHVRVQALQTIVRAYCPPSKGATVSSEQMMEILKFDSPDDTVSFCEGHGMVLKDNGRDFRLYRNDFFFPETKIKQNHSSSLITSKRSPLMKAVIGDGEHNLRNFEYHKVHSSFTSGGRLSKMAFDASDQKRKSLVMVDKSSDEFVERNKFDVDMTDLSQADVDMKEEKRFEKDEFIFYEDVKDEGEDSLTMEIDEEMLQDDNFNSMKKEKASIEKEVNLSKDNTLTSKQYNIPSSFKFDLKAVAKPEIKVTPVQEVSSNFRFDGFKNASSNTNPLFDGNIKSNQLSLNMFHTGNDKIPSQQSNETHKDLLNYNQATLLSSPQSQIVDEKSVNVDNLNKIQSKIFDNDSTYSSSDATSFSMSKDCVLPSASEEEEIKSMETVFSSIQENLVSQSNAKNELPVFTLHKSNENALKFDQQFSRMADVDNNVSEKIDKNKVISKYNKQQTLRSIRINLKKRLEAASVRRCIRKWRQKIEKIKQIRSEFPVLYSVPVDQHASIWGITANINSFANYSVLDRIKDRRHSSVVVNTILRQGIKDSLPYLGHEIAEKIASCNYSELKLKDFNIPICWKLIISVPFDKENDFFVKKFSHWFRNLFYKSKNSPLGSVTEEITSENIPVYYCIHLVSGNDFRDQKDLITGMSGLLFFIIDGFENPSDKCKRLRNLLSCDKNLKPVPISILKIGKNYYGNDKLTKVLDEKLKNNKIQKWGEEYWDDFSSILRVLNFLTMNLNFSNKLYGTTLFSLLKNISEHIYNALNTLKSVSLDFSTCLTNPNFIIKFYTAFFSLLEKIIINNNFKDYQIVPQEFKDYIKYLKKPGESALVSIDFRKARRPNITKAFSKFKLPDFERWPPDNEEDLLNTWRLYCDYLNCNRIFSRIIRIIDLKEDVELLKYLNNVLWIDVIDLIMRHLIQCNYTETQQIVIFCNEDEISDLCQIEFSIKLFQFLINYKH